MSNVPTRLGRSSHNRKHLQQALGAAAAAAALALVAVPVAHAADVRWNVADGNWTDSANWLGGVVPGAADRALLDFAAGGTTHVTTDIDDVLNLSVKTGSTLSIEAGGQVHALVGNSSPVVNDPLQATRIGDGSAGTAIVTDGTLFQTYTAAASNQSADIYVGVGAGGNGTLTQNATVGSATPSLIHTRDFRVGSDTGVGVYHQNGGTMETNFIIIGRTAGTGTYNLGGGVATANQFRLGDGNNSVGNFNFTGGTITATLEANFGITGSSTVVHSGGTLNVSGTTGEFWIGRNSGAGLTRGTGVYTLSGTGAIAVTTSVNVGQAGGKGTLTMSGGTVSGDDFYIGGGTAQSGVVRADGLFNQSAGTVTTTGRIRVAHNGGIGVYNISGNAQVIIGTGAGDVDPLDDDFFIGSSTGGTAPNVSASSGTVTVADSALVTMERNFEMGVTGGAATMTQTGGDIDVGVDVNIGTSGGGGFAGTATYAMSAGTLDVGQNLTVGLGGNVNGTMNLSGSAAVTVVGAVMIGNDATVGAVLNQSGGTLTAASLGTRTGVGTVGDYNLSSGTLTTGLVTNNGNFNYTGGTATIGGIAGTGTTTVAAGLNLAADSVTQGAVNVDGKITVRPNGDVTGVSRIGAITLGAAGKLDLTDNKLITPMAAGTWNGAAYTDVAGLVDSGRGSAGNAMWDGASGITTSDTRAINNGDLISIGVAKTSEVRTVADTETTTFAGQTVLGSDTLVMATWGGDANLDGKINIDDYGRIDGNVGQSGTVFGWSKGDFNYDGKINIDDYGIIDGNINRQGAPIVTAGSAASVALDGVAAVPEPASLSLVAIGATALLRRRRRA